jgi:hypothetical protein
MSNQADDLKWRELADCIPVIGRQVLLRDGDSNSFAAGVVIFDSEPIVGSYTLSLQTYPNCVLITNLDKYFTEWTYLD